MSRDGFLTSGEAARYVGISKIWLLWLAEAGKVPCKRVSHGTNAWRYFAIKDLDALKAQRQKRSAVAAQ